VQRGPSIVTEWHDVLEDLPFFPLAHLPTPLEEAERLSKRLGVRILIKRDDQTGLAMGGNKARKLEYLIADALSAGADTVITTGGSQSNHARMTAAACRLAGLDCYLVLDRGIHPEAQGNILLDRLLGANVQIVDSEDPAVSTDLMKDVAESVRSRGKTPYIIPRGGSVAVGAAGYVGCILELVQQLEIEDISITHLYLPTGSGGTHAGIMAGQAITGWDAAIQGISVSRDGRQLRATVLQLANQTLEFLKRAVRVSEEDVLVDDGFRGPGYGRTTTASMEAIETAARDEAIILDPVYTGKAMAGLIAHAREGRFTSTNAVIFLHTGGAPGVFAYHEELAEAIADRKE
jgi:D-cysteine desulfhydrase family pyridoxal phosphate-dependent enzyme